LQSELVVQFCEQRLVWIPVIAQARSPVAVVIQLFPVEHGATQAGVPPASETQAVPAEHAGVQSAEGSADCRHEGWVAFAGSPHT
jgi:hypothetical protein